VFRARDVQNARLVGSGAEAQRAVCVVPGPRARKGEPQYHLGRSCTMQPGMRLCTAVVSLKQGLQSQCSAAHHSGSGRISFTFMCEVTTHGSN